jgi:hypothetical protein
VPPLDLSARSWFRLREFQDRVRIVMDSVIARQADVATLGTTMRIIAEVGRPGVGSIAWDHPPVEAIEQAAARLRPIFLENEEVFYFKVMTSIGYLAQGASTENRQVIAALRSAWKELTDGMYWSLAVAADAEGRESAPMHSDRQIATDWLYGDLVHADPKRRRRIRHVPEGYRILAGLLWAKDGILLTRATQQLIVDLEDRGELSST